MDGDLKKETRKMKSGCSKKKGCSRRPIDHYLMQLGMTEEEMRKADGGEIVSSYNEIVPGTYESR